LLALRIAAAYPKDTVLELYLNTDAALVALDPATGDILAMVGSADYWDESIDGAVNVALAHRKPGSAITPLTCATAIDPGRWGLHHTGDDPNLPALTARCPQRDGGHGLRGACGRAPWVHHGAACCSRPRPSCS
jgi:membrane peptidoglycan carboxypeptidase